MYYVFAVVILFENAVICMYYLRSGGVKMDVGNPDASGGEPNSSNSSGECISQPVANPVDVGSTSVSGGAAAQPSDVR